MNTVNRQKAMNLIGLAMRAGKLITGEELTIAEIRKQKAKLVFVATDASENTRKKIKPAAKIVKERAKAAIKTVLTITTNQTITIAANLMDAGFAKKTKELIEG
ncbi:50S ribosomal protein L7/L12 [Enterococcus faecium]|nr:50S ribosomal protein L7/L12 [Enterococcus faecium]